MTQWHFVFKRKGLAWNGYFCGGGRSHDRWVLLRKTLPHPLSNNSRKKTAAKWHLHGV